MGFGRGGLGILIDSHGLPQSCCLLCGANVCMFSHVFFMSLLLCGATVCSVLYDVLSGAPTHSSAIPTWRTKTDLATCCEVPTHSSVIPAWRTKTDLATCCETSTHSNDIPTWPTIHRLKTTHGMVWYRMVWYGTVLPP